MVHLICVVVTSCVMMVSLHKGIFKSFRFVNFFLFNFLMFCLYV
jgi:hypothetical protein